MTTLDEVNTESESDGEEAGEEDADDALEQAANGVQERAAGGGAAGPSGPAAGGGVDAMPSQGDPSTCALWSANAAIQLAVCVGVHLAQGFSHAARGLSRCLVHMTCRRARGTGYV
jgi:hypothetical protein